jgi:hypothetical protein
MWRLLSAIGHWARFGSSAGLRSYERACLLSWRSRLPQEAAILLDRQLQFLTFIQRLSDGKLITFYCREGQLPDSVLFPNTDSESIAAIFHLRIDSSPESIRGRIVLHKGRLSSIEFQKVPSYFPA